MRSQSIALVALALFPVALSAQRLQPHFANVFNEPVIVRGSSMLPAFHSDTQPSRGPYVLGGALLGGTLAVVTVGPALVKAQIGSEPLIYAVSAAGGALVGAFVGLIVYEISHDR